MAPVVVAVFVLAAAAAAVVRFAAPEQQVTAAAVKRPPPLAADYPPARGLRIGEVTVRPEGFLSWAVLDRRTGRIIGSPNMAAPSDTMSMVKAWLAADYLHDMAKKGEEPSGFRLGQLTAMIRDSDNAAAITIYDLVGRRRSILRMIEICGLTDSRAHPTNWSNTVVSARDTVRLASCIADGRAAGRRWTPWILSEMCAVRGDGDFGVRRAIPEPAARAIAIKNGWLLRDEDGLWHIACLAVADQWAIGVLVRYPGSLGFTYGTTVCRTVGEQLLAPSTPLASPVPTPTTGRAH